MKKSILMGLAAAGILSLGSAASAQVTLDGSLGDAGYTLLGTAVDFGYGNGHGVGNVYAGIDATNLYIGFAGQSSAGFESILIHVGSADVAGGIPSGMVSDRSANGFTPFENWGSIYDFELDYSFAWRRGGGGANDCDISVMNYTESTGDKTVRDRNLIDYGVILMDGSVTTAPAMIDEFDGGGVGPNQWAGLQISVATPAADAAAAITANTGLELAIPLSLMGSSTMTTAFNIQVHSIGGDGHNYSNNIMPPIAGFTNGDIGTGGSIPSPIDFTAASGDNFVAFNAGSSVGNWELY